MSRVSRMLVILTVVLFGVLAVACGVALRSDVEEVGDKVDDLSDQLLSTPEPTAPLGPNISCLPDTLGAIYGWDVPYEVLDVLDGFVYLLPNDLRAAEALGGTIAPEEKVNFEMRWFEDTVRVDNIPPVPGMSGRPLVAFCFEEQALTFLISVDDYCEAKDRGDIWSRGITESIVTEELTNPCREEEAPVPQ